MNPVNDMSKNAFKIRKYRCNFDLKFSMSNEEYRNNNIYTSGHPGRSST